MSTNKLSRERLPGYFDDFTKRHLRDDLPETVAIEVLSPERGDQHLVTDAHLLGITYDPNSNALEVALGSGDHRVYDPKEVWVREDDDGFPSAIEVIRPDGVRELLRLTRGAARGSA